MALYKAAAASDFPPAEFGLGVAYQNGRGVPADPALAAKWYRMAAEHDMPAATDRLADLERGDLDPQTGAQRAAPRS